MSFYSYERRRNTATLHEYTRADKQHSPRTHKSALLCHRRPQMKEEEKAILHFAGFLSLVSISSYPATWVPVFVFGDMYLCMSQNCPQGNYDFFLSFFPSTAPDRRETYILGMRSRSSSFLANWWLT